MIENNMPRFIEEKLKKEYGDNPHAIYGTMNKLGLMKGNKETKKGKREEMEHEEKEHEAKTKALKRKLEERHEKKHGREEEKEEE
jgi:hypothetical protein